MSDKFATKWRKFDFNTILKKRATLYC
jgi:hypothetical protein